MMNTISVTDLNFVSNQNVAQYLDATDSMSLEYMPPWGYTLTACCLFLIGFFGFFLNLLVIVLMCKDIQIWTPMNIILLNLVASDFSVSIIGNPFTLTSTLHHKWIFGETVCEAYGFFMSLLGITSIATLTVLSYERYCLVSCPFSAAHLTKQGAKYAVVLIWVYSLFVTSPPLFGWGKYINEAANISCSVNWESQTLNATTYIVFLFIFGLVVPVIVIGYSYIRIILTMRENSLRSGRVNKVESRVTYMIFVMIIAFLVAWTPYSIFALSEQFGDPDLITPALAVLPALIAKSSICYNPLIYVGMNSQFRAAWRRVYRKEKTPTAINETTVNQISESSSRAYIECSFTHFEKKKKGRCKDKPDKPLANIHLKSLKSKHFIEINETLNNNNNNSRISLKSNIEAKEKNIHAFQSPTKANAEIKSSLELKPFNFTRAKNIIQNDYELRMFSSEANIHGKTFNQIIRTNSYKSNLF